MKINRLKDYLLDNRNLSEIFIKENEVYSGVSYDFVILCKLTALKKTFSIAIGIPENWEINLVDIYLVDDDRLFIPHLDNKGKLCLFDLEASLIDWDLFGILGQCIEQAKNVVEAGLSGTNHDDFIEEFDSYIGNVKGKKYLKLVLPTLKEPQKISYCEAKSSGGTRRKKENYSAYKKRTKVVEYFASSDQNDFINWGYASATQKNALYLYVEPETTMYPPDFSNGITKEYLNNILSLAVLGNVKFTPNQTETLVVIEIMQPAGISNVLSVIIEVGEFEISNTSFYLKNSNKIVPLSCERLDGEYLLRRTSGTENVLTSKNFLLVGCGSIGSRVFENLIRSGVKKITLIDYDFLKAENIYRHLLGIESIKYGYKAEALKKYGDRTLPDLDIIAVDDKLEEALSDGSIELKSFDYVIAATGNSILNRWLNNYIHENKIEVPIFYLWNEPLDIGSHVGYFRLDSESCYNCLFARDEEGSIYDKYAYTKKGQIIVKSNAGCQGSFIPYGSLVSVQTSLLFMRVLKQVVVGRLAQNALFSQKGDNYFFEEAGLELSETYLNQREIIENNLGEQLVEFTCEVCGDERNRL